MGRIIEGQVVAGTGVDVHGERLSREELERLVAAWDDHVPTGVNHDLSLAPVCRTFHPRIVLRRNGEWVMVVDVEVFDEDSFAKFGGFSISFSRTRVRIGPDPAVAEIAANPRHFDLDALVRELAPIGDRTGTVDLVELVQKGSALETAVISISVFVGLQTFSGFFNAAGAALFEVLRRQRRTDEPTGPVSIQFYLRLSEQRRVPVIILGIDAGCSVEDVRSVDGPRLLDFIQASCAGGDVQRVTARLNSEGVVIVDRIVGSDGSVIFDADA